MSNSGQPSLFCLAAADPDALRAEVARVLAGSSPQAPAASGPARLALRCDDAAELRERLERARELLAAGERPRRGEGLFLSRGWTSDALAFLFPGQGSQYVGMGDALRSLPGFDAALQEADGVASVALGRSLRERFSLGRAAPAAAAALSEELTATENAQPAVGLIDAAAHAALTRLGLRPRYLAGHSYGELVALHAGGAYDLSELFALSAERGRLLGGASARAPGKMLALRATPRRAADLLEGIEGVAVPANLNAPRQTVVSGSAEAIDALAARCQALDLPARPIPTACAFHSPLMAPVAAEWRAFLAERAFAAPAPERVLSSVEAAPYPADPAAVRRTLAEQITAPVRWVETVEALYARGARVFLEVGPKQVLSGLVRKILGKRDHLALNLDPHPGRDPLAHLLELLGELYCQGAALDLSGYAPTFSLPPAASAAPSAPLPAAPGALQLPPLPPGAETGPLASFLSSGRAALEAFYAQQQRLLAAQGGSLDPAQRAVYLAELSTTGQELLSELLELQEAALARAAGQGAAPAPAPPAGASSLETWLREELCRITGFPPEAITRESQFEADLGLDSITLIEVWVSLQERFPAAAGEESQLRNLRSVGALLDFAEAASAGAVPAPAPRGSQPPEPAQQERQRASVPASPPTPPPAARDAGASDALARLRARLIEDLGVEPDELVDEADFEQDLAVDVFSRQALLDNLLQDAPRLRLAGRALLEVQTWGELRQLFERLDPGAPEAADPLRRYTAREVALELAPAEPPPALLLVGAPALLGPLRAAAPAARELRREAEGWRLPAGAGEDESVLQAADVAGLSRELRRRCGPSALDVVFVAHAPAADVDAALTLGGESLFLLAQALASNGPPRSLTVLGAADASPASPLWTTARGANRSLAREWPQTRCASLWLEQPSDLPRALGLLSELPPEHDLRLNRAGVLSRRELSETPLPAPPPLPLERESVVVVVGGGGGLGAELSLALARQGCAVAVTGRTAWPESPPYPQLHDDAALKRQIMEDLRAAGAPHHPAAIQARFRIVRRQRGLLALREGVEQAGGRFLYAAADGRSAGALAAALEQFRAAGPLHGLIHAAGVTQDELLGQKTLATFRRVVDTKARALASLRAATQGDSLRFALLLSSLASHAGTAGQTDYAAANDAVNALAAAWDAEASYPVRALLFSVWGEAGLASPALLKQMRRRGLGTIGTAEGIAACLAEAASPGPPWVLYTPASTLRFVLGSGS
ncbi:MAG TPA: hypothetical protein DEA08_31280 [Planctomycetes bacterium]|nr:hypothetical protein [Planctomycetota bacterium]